MSRNVAAFSCCTKKHNCRIGNGKRVPGKEFAIWHLVHQSVISFAKHRRNLMKVMIAVESKCIEDTKNWIQMELAAESRHATMVNSLMIFYSAMIAYKLLLSLQLNTTWKVTIQNGQKHVSNCFIAHS